MLHPERPSPVASTRLTAVVAAILLVACHSAEPLGESQEQSTELAPRAILSAPPILETGTPHTARPTLQEPPRSYRLDLEAQDYARLAADQRGIDVALTLRRPGGEPLLMIDSPTRDHGREILELYSETGGTYEVRVETLTVAPEGSYTLILEHRGAATPVEIQRAEATRLLAYAEDLGRQGGQESLEQALPHFRRAREIWRSLRAETELAIALERLGDTLRQLGRRREALPLFQKAEALFSRQGIEDPRTAAMANNMGVISRYLGQAEDAAAYYEEALAAWRRLGNSREQARVLNNLGRLSSAEGHMREALDFYQQALARWRQLGDPQQEAVALNSLGGFYFLMGEKEMALDYLLQARALLSDSPTRTLGTNLKLSADIWRQLNQPQRAAAGYRAALAIYEELGHRSTQGHVWIGLGRLALRAGNWRSALEYFATARELFEELEDSRGRAIVLHGLGVARALGGEAAQAFADHHQALELATQQGDPVARSANLLRLARLEQERGDLDAAIGAIEEAVRSVEELRRHTDRLDLRVSFFANRQEYYDAWVDVLMALDHERPGAGFRETAFTASERSRARGLLDQLTPILSNSRAVPDNLRSRREDLHRQIEREAARSFEATEKPSDLASGLRQQRIRRLLDAYRSLTNEPFPTSWELPFEPPSVAQIRRDFLDSETALLHYHPGTEKSWAFLLTRDQLISAELPPASALEDLALGAHRLFSSSHRQLARHAVASQQRRAGKILLAPLTERPSAIRRLLISSIGALQYVPFGALELPGANGDLLLEHFELVYIPSVAVLQRLKDRNRSGLSSPGVLAVLADPVFDISDPRLRSAIEEPSTIPPAGEGASVSRGAPDPSGLLSQQWGFDGGPPRLPATGQEARSILDMVPPGLPTFRALGFEANRDLVTRGDLRGFRILHFATHSLIHDSYPELSGLILSRLDPEGRTRDGFLGMPEVASLDLEPELVVLSACRTAIGPRIRGEGLVGLTHGFFRAGARSVLVSLWDVSDKPTAELMRRFYHALLIDRHSPIEALRQAQLQLLQHPDYGIPSFWAGFVLQGDWQVRILDPEEIDSD